MNLSLLIFAIIAFLSTDAFSDDRSSSREKLKALRVQIESQQRALKNIRFEKDRLITDIGRIKSELSSLEVLKKEHAKDLKRIDEELEVLELSQAENGKRTEKEREILGDRLSEMYKLNKRQQGVSFLLTSGSMQDLLRRSYMLRILAENGDSALKRLSELQRQLNEEKMHYQDLRAAREKRISEIAALGVSLETKRKESSALVLRSESREKDQEESLNALRVQARSLEEALASLMGESDEEKRPGEIPVFEGSGLASLKGRIELPVRGKLVQGFGKSQHEEFSDLVVVKGVEISSAVGLSVHPVSVGKVVLAQVVPGFGNVVIVDHGSRYYTLYGRLASTLVQPGQVVSDTDSLGVTGEPDHRGRNFYFELRFKGKAVDPKEYLKTFPSS